jgi:hypothetical protein
MVSNGNPQFIRNVFPLQADEAAGSKKLTEVVQDKARLKAARSTTLQPAAMANGLRAKHTLAQHSSKKPSSKTLTSNIVTPPSTASDAVDGFSGNVHPTESRYFPTAQSEPQNFQGRCLITRN